MKLNTKALAYSAAITVLLIAALTIGAELSEPLKAFLKGVSGHHWTTKGLFSLIAFELSYLALSRSLKESKDIRKETRYVIASAILGGLAIFLFFVWHFIS